MDSTEIKKHIDAIIENTFKALKDLYDHQQEKERDEISHYPRYSRIIFPKYSNEDTRLSEQELRFIFVEKFNQYCGANNLNWFYSVETPTKYKYLIKNQETPHKVQAGEKGQSAMIDFVIHNDKFERFALIEFKALNPKEADFAKDFEKLDLEVKEEKNEINTYFIMYVKSYKDCKNQEKNTLHSLYEKVYEAPKTKRGIGESTTFKCYSLETGEDITKQIETYNQRN